MDTRKIIGFAVLALLVIAGVARVASVSSEVTSAPAAATAPTDKWHVTESRSAMDDSRTVVLMLDSENTISGPLGEITPSLIIRCKEKTTKIYVHTGMATTVEEGLDGGPSESHKVGLRLDDSPARYESWNESTDHTALFADNEAYGERGVVYPAGAVVNFAKQLAQAKTLTFQFTPFDGSPQTARFDLRGLDKYLPQVGAACGWSVD